MNRYSFALDRIHASASQRHAEVSQLLALPDMQDAERLRLEQELAFVATLLAMIPAD
jgi:hypothetical protein